MPFKAQEEARIQELYRYEILDTPPEPEFDRLTSLAADIFQVPMAFISLVDTDRQWFKSRIGIDTAQTPRSVVFCDHAIRQDEVLYIPDAAKDPRFSSNPLVTDDPKLRFYAGAALVTPAGQKIGTLCVADRRGRELTPKQLDLLSDLSALVVGQLEFRRLLLAEAALRKEAQAAFKTKTQFLSRISHEIRTPLTAILGYADILLMTPGASDKSAVEFIHEAGNELLAIFNDLLDIEKALSGELAFRRDQITLEPGIEKLRDIFSAAAAAKGIELHLSLDWNGLEPRTFVGDAHRLRQMVFNVVGNAVKFTEAGRVHVHTSLHPGDASHYRLVMEISDTGPGIDDANIERIFEPFEQVDTTTTRAHGGTGLGLSVARHIAEVMGGTLTAQSKLGLGSTFKINVPLELAAKANDGAAVRADTEPTKVPLAGLRVLLAEDSRINAMLIKNMLSAWGCAVSIANDGIEALHCMEQRPFDVLLLDLHMPRCDGHETMRRMRGGSGLKLPTVVLTADAYESTRKACFDAGCVAFVTKPIDWGELYRAIQSALSAADQRQRVSA